MQATLTFTTPAEHRARLPRPRRRGLGVMPGLATLLAAALALALPAGAQLTLRPAVYETVLQAATRVDLILTPAEIERLDALRVVQGTERRFLFTEFDDLRLSRRSGFRLAPGEDLFIVKLRQPVYDPESRHLLGQVASFTARLRVRDVVGREVRAVTRQTSEEMVLDDAVVLLAAGEPLPAPEALRRRQQALRHGRIVASRAGATLLSEGAVVFLNVGTVQQVRPGMRLPILAWQEIDTREPGSPRHADRPETQRLPPAPRRLAPETMEPASSRGGQRKVRLGELRATLVRDHLSTAVITTAGRDIQVGDFVELPAAAAP